MLGPVSPSCLVFTLANAKRTAQVVEFTLCFIADGVHTHRSIIQLAWRMLGPRRINLVTDAMAALGMPAGKHLLGDFEVVVDATSARLSDGTLAGSILSLDQALRNIETALEALTEASYYLTVERNRYRFSLKENLNKRFKLAAAFYNLSQLMRKLFGFGTPKQLAALSRAFVSLLVRLWSLIAAITRGSVYQFPHRKLLGSPFHLKLATPVAFEIWGSSTGC